MKLPNEVIKRVLIKNSIDPILKFVDSKIDKDYNATLSLNITLHKPVCGHTMIVAIYDKRDNKLSFYKDFEDENKWIIIRWDKKIIGNIEYDKENQLIVGILDDDDVASCQIIQKCYRGDLVRKMMKRMMRLLQEKYDK